MRWYNETQEANAWLIAAAPDLLASCQEAIEEYRLAKIAGFDPRMLICLEKTAKLAAAAIRKATGEMCVMDILEG